MNVLIIGGSGLVGSNLYEVFSASALYTTVIATHLKFPLKHTKFFDPLSAYPEYILNTAWDVIIHTGALTHVDKCEQEEYLSYRLTVQSTQKLLELAEQNKSKFVYISTDYIFNGLSGPYKETDLPDPINVYGKHKLIAENLVTNYLDSLVIRITNVYGKEARNKNFIARIIADLANNNSIIITAPVDQFATPVNALDIAKAINHLVDDKKNGIYHISSTDYLSRVQLLHRINKHYNNRIIIVPKQTNEMQQQASRPLLGGLCCSKFISEYPNFIFTNVDDYINFLNNERSAL